ncbi:hypothetical protein DKY63_29715 [Pseudomonas putida]|uniref:Uncharacterized protein n=1 Tax=Pseudomonas putida TaxID=303 RepID=A0A2Z4RS75_PSEPU|nr:SGNH/GDSL hydrolase family protein [Pseudomonas putida]AWY43866.1 hypothetical protein DKY63_29715 [Pseudomonas putida]
MTIFATFNPIGSTHPKDLIDNAQNLDYLILGPAPAYPDRRSVSRLSWAGIEAAFATAQSQRAADFTAAQSQRANDFTAAQSQRANDFTVAQNQRTSDFNAAQAQRAADYAASEQSRGYENPVPYAAGIVLTRVTQLIQYNSELYKAKAGTLPWTTTGIWATDSVKLVSIGDAALRQQLAMTGGASLVNYSERTVKDKLDEHRSLYDFVAANAGNVTVAVTAAEASSSEYIDLAGGTFQVALQGATLTKKYYGGTLLVLNPAGNYGKLKNQAPVTDVQVAHPRTKCPVVDWSGLSALWLGTSIPHQGVGVDGYPELFGKTMGVGVTNMAWSGSHAGYDVGGDAFAISTIAALSMTEDDRLAGLAAYGPSSAYSDTFDLITKPSQMTADYRIRQAFGNTQLGYGVVILDHAHNDMNRALGTKTPETQTVTGVTVGATTSITLSAVGTIAVGDAVTLRVTGIPKLDYLSGRVQTKSGNTITLSYNSTGHTGTFASGTVTKLDRSTIMGAWSFLVSYIRHSSFIAQGVYPVIITAGAPSEFTNNEPTPSIYSVAEKVREFADTLSLGFFDIAYFMDVKKGDQLRYFPDGVHATTTATRQVLTNFWVQWASGGAARVINRDAVIQRAGTAAFLKNHELIYDEYTDGFSTPSLVEGKSSLLHSDDFSSGSLAAYTTVGAVSIVDAPWGAGKSMRAVPPPGTGVFNYIQKALAFNSAIDASFDFYMTNLAGATSGLISLFDLANGAGLRYLRISLVVTASGAFLRVSYFKNPSADVVTMETNTKVTMGVKHTIRVKVRKSVTGLPSGILLYLDGVLITQRITVDNFGQTNPAVFILGAVDNTTGVTQNLYYGPISFSTAAILDTTVRASGSFTTNDGKTVTVANGIITSIV